MLRSSRTANIVILSGEELLLQKSPRVSRVKEVKEVVKSELEYVM